MSDSTATLDKLKRLVEHFDLSIDTLKSNNYNETQVRREFIDPFFKLLGWDVDNEKGYAEAYKDVIHEDAIKIGSYTKAPDYCFRIGGTRKFFVEAKKPAVNIKEDVHPAYQLRRYAWSAKLPLSILTDFEEFAVYDCRNKPHKTDKASASRIEYITFHDYVDQWEKLTGLFSREAVLKGSFDKFAESKKGKHGTAEVDAEFLKEIESWREMLARNIALRNPSLSVYELNFAVQRTIDRIIFLRIAEDRGLEKYGRLQALCNGTEIYPRLTELFELADERYNSGLFHFRQEKGQAEESDRFTLELVLDDKPLKAILSKLYYPDSPYEFSVLPAEILGQVYEQFLGKVIRLTAGHRARIEDKPEVKKAGGVYYTPKYIVDYIVENTVGKMLEGMTPNKIQGSGKKGYPLRVLDPACGSGSFLLGAYQYLLDWYRDRYVEKDPEKLAKKKVPILYQAPGGAWHLSTTERKRILLDHIYGVDIDSQAVEVTKLSLLLKVLEGENTETIGKHFALFHQRVLPDLGNNIKCGNSLIGSDFYRGKERNLFNEDEIARVNAFDWEEEFPEVFELQNAKKKDLNREEGSSKPRACRDGTGGFDVVIGNPPYGALFLDREIDYLSQKYASYEYQLNSFVIFIEKGGSLLRENGKVSYITPAVFLAQHYFKNIRQVILERYSIENILVLNYKVFNDVHIGDTCVFVFSNIVKRDRSVQYSVLKEEFTDDIEMGEVEQVGFLKNPRYEIYLSENQSLISKINSRSTSLGSISNCIMGIKPYQKGKGKPKQVADDVKNRIYDSDFKKDDSYKKYLIGKDINRYVVAPLKQKYISYGKWLAEPRTTAPFEKDKIILRQTSDKIRAVIDQEKYYNLNNIYNIEILDQDFDYNYILGIINSKLMVYVYQHIVPEKGKLFAEIKKVSLAKLPIRKIDCSISADKKAHDNLISLVDQMLQLNKRLGSANVPHIQKTLERQIASTDKEIDRLVYELYGLTEEEIKIVEGKG